MSPSKPGLRERLATTDEFVTVTELVAWRGPVADKAGRAGLAAAHALVDDPRIAAISITDNAGGHAMARPALLAEEFLARGQDVIVHVACRDRSRNGLLSLAWELERRGVRNVLAVSGDHPVEGFEGLSRPVFDVDSVGLLALYRDLTEGSHSDAAAAPQPGFYLGCAVSPFKRLEAEVIPQYLKLALKVRAGADFVIPQLGYDARAWDELLRWMRRADLRIPAIASVYVLSRTVARLFNANRIPGCVVSDQLLAIAEREAAAADKGRAFFLELAARQVAIARGLGFRGVYLAGHLPAADVAQVLDTAASYAPDDWRAFAREIAYAPKGSFRFFAGDPATRPRDRRARSRVRPEPDAPCTEPGPPPGLALVQGQPARPPPGVRARDAGLPGGRPRLRAARGGPSRAPAPRPGAGGQGAALRLPRLRRLLAARRRLPVPRVAVPQGRAQRSLRRVRTTASARCRRGAASGSARTSGSSRTARSSRCSSARR